MRRFAFDMPEMVATISEKTFLPEDEAVATLRAFLETGYPAEKIRHATIEMVGRLREKGAGHGVEAFLQEYPLGTPEGLALMCLAEALLRIPDKSTQEKLIESTFESAHWDKHVTLSGSWFVKASAFGLKLSDRVMEWGQAGAASLFSSLARKWGEPVVREGLKKAMHIMGNQFVMGQNVAEAAKHAARWEKAGSTLSFDMLGEGARDAAQANHYFEAYQQAIVELGKDAPASADIHAMRAVSIKLSGLHPRYHLTQWSRLKAELYPKLKHLVLLARKHHLAVSIDAEEAQRFDVNLWLFSELFRDADLQDYPHLGFVLQAYQKRAFYAIDALASLSAELGKPLPVRLVKGAYWDSEIKWAQVQGLKDYPVFTLKAHTDISYLACAKKLLDAEGLQPQFATHNAYTIQAVLALAEGRAFEFQRLHGMGEGVYALLQGHYPVRIYAPVGRHDALLPYLIRRLLENGANTSFVRQVMDKDIAAEMLAENPLAQSYAPSLPLPKDLFGAERRNSSGVDLGYAAMLRQVEDGLTPFEQHFWHQGEGQDIRNPAQWQDEVGSHALTAPEQVRGIMETAQKAHLFWAKWPVEKRAEVLEHMADVLEKHAFEACALLMREAGRQVADAIGELREAQDFCRYYAAEARKLMGQPQALQSPVGEDNQLLYAPRGVFLCISPWNFPLSIFLGQVSAALVTGNAVVAKPAAQTPLIACKVAEWFREAGLPSAILQLALGEGRSVGQALVEHPAVAGVVFTGSTATAQHINRSLAAKTGAIVPFIAETGGQNAMVVDSSALLEQACDDIIASAFGSAGQRCSALRVLYVQAEVADALIELITGAMAEITVADVWNAATDVGAVIDKPALSRLEKHVDYLNSISATWHVPPQKLTLDGYFFPPVLVELQSIAQLQGEVFGPVLHVIRYKEAELEKVIEAVNSTGFGLTFGIHSRVQATVDYVASRIHAGNIYVNRSMIGAVVGVQPFGGEGLSGTGFKAGGPHYLTRFVHERTRTINTAAIGGNVELLKE